MFVSAKELTKTEELLTEYFINIRTLKIWRASVTNRQECKKRLEARIQSGLLIHFSDNVGSPFLSCAVPSNRQPPKGLDACIDKAKEVYDNLLIELHTTELDILTTEEKIEELERNTMIITEVIKTLDNESIKVLELRLVENNSFEDIGDIIKKSKTTVYNFYRKSIDDICERLKSMGFLKINEQNRNVFGTFSEQNRNEIGTKTE